MCQNYGPGVCNVGMIRAKPGAFNIVPAEVYCALEFRHGSQTKIWTRCKRDLITPAWTTCAAEFDLSVSYEATPAGSPRDHERIGHERDRARG